MNYYSHNIGDYAQATMHLSLIEDAIYSRLLRRYYAEETPIVNDLQQVSRWVGARSEEEREAVAVILNEFFELRDGYWYNKRADEEIAAYKAKAETARVNGSKGGRPKNEPKPKQTNNKNNPKPTNEKPNNNPQETHPVNLANPEETGLKANQETRTNNHKPIVEAAYNTSEERSATSPEESLPPANPENIPDEAPSRNVQVAILLRSHGADPSTHPNSKGISAIVDLNATDEHILTALETVKTRRKEANDPQPVNAAYLVPIIAGLQKPQTEKPDSKPRDEWYRTEPGIDRKARELGMFARAGESYNEFKDRMFQEIKRREREQQGATV